MHSIKYILQIGLLLHITNAQQIRVEIRQGTISGIVSNTERGSRYFSFLGIPYALAPIQDLRFKDPVRHPGWPGELLATEYGPRCPQWSNSASDVVGQEDCLTLNVHTPRIPAKYPVELLPVMFYIHGGGFKVGSSGDNGAAKLLTEPVVLVTANYRLGVFGFMSTEDELSPGNYGMMDLVMALQWVQENIRSFGGDNQRVTIFGESAGAAAVSHLTISPLSRGLFWAAITQSGNALCDWAIEENPLKSIGTLADSMGCDTTTSSNIVQCLRQTSTEDIIRAQQSQLPFESFPIRMIPVIDAGHRSPPFLPDIPERLIQRGDFSRVPLISGVVKDEGMFFVLQLVQQFTEKLTSDPTFMEQVLIPQSIDAMTGTFYTPNKIEHLKNFYFKNVHFQNLTEVIPSFVHATSDIMINSCNDRMVKLYTEYAPTYMYVFSHRGLFSHSDPMIDALRLSGIQTPLFQTGVPHVDDLLYLFNLPNSKPHVRPEDQRVQEIMILLWTTFARTGNPIMPPRSAEDQSTTWNSLRKTDLTYLDISNHLHISKDYRQFELSILDFINSLTSGSPPFAKYTSSNDREPYFTATWVLVAVAAVLLTICIVLAVILIIKARQGSYSTDSLMRKHTPTQ